METIETIIVSILSAFIASFFTHYFGFRQYLKEKRREEISTTYIKNGIDRIIEALNLTYFNCHFNFSKAMRIIECLEKSLGIGIEEEILRDTVRQIFSEMKPTIAAPEFALHKLQVLTGANYKNITSWIIETLADYSKYNDYLRYELFLEVNYYFYHPERFKGREKIFLENLKKTVSELFDKIIPPHELLVVHLLNLKIRVDEMEISNMKDLDKVPKDKRVKEILAAVERDYKK
jgi:hypothetical protein